jgi:xanthine dehydrogenase small subunit
MQSVLSFVLDGKIVKIDFNGRTDLAPTTTVLQYLRKLPNHKGTKEGCAEGDCGACTVVIAEPSESGRLKYTAINSCLVFLPMIHGKQVITVENLRYSSGTLHPVQQAMIECYGSQCGFCTPGIIMTLFAFSKKEAPTLHEEIAAIFAGNLCRCTGYATILRAAEGIVRQSYRDQFDESEKATLKMLSSIQKKDLKLTTGSQEYLKSFSLSSALEYRQQFPDAVIVHGATDIALRVTKKFEQLQRVLDISAIAELKTHTNDEQGVLLGAGMNIRDIAVAVGQTHPALKEILSVFGSAQIRSLATIGGNIASASPIGDTLPILMACNTSVVVKHTQGQREIALVDFIVGYRKTVLEPKELIVGVRIPPLAAADIVRSYKISKRHDVDISTVNAGFRLQLDKNQRIADIALIYGGMAEFTRRATKTEQFLLGKEWNCSNAELAGRYLEKDFTPISDVRGSAEFRMVAAKNLLIKFWSDTVGGAIY